MHDRGIYMSTHCCSLDTAIDRPLSFLIFVDAHCFIYLQQAAPLLVLERNYVYEDGVFEDSQAKYR